MTSRPASATADAFLREHPELLTTDLTSPDFIATMSRWTAPLERYFRFSALGWENLPPGPCLLVANHSVGSPFVLPLLSRAWHRNVPDRPGRGLMHRVAWQSPFRQLGTLQKLGGLYAHPDVGRAALARGCSVLVFPGGDVDAMRPFTERYRPDFGGRTGFAALARECKVPAVPFPICGSHAAYVMLPGARRVASMIGLHRWTGLRHFPLTLGTAGLLATALAPPLWPLLPGVALAALLPLPTRIEGRFLPPLSVQEGETDAGFAERVRQRIEDELLIMAATRTTPLG